MDEAKTIFCDLDGTIFKHHGDIIKQLKNHPILNPEVLSTLVTWTRKGYRIIITTGRPEGTRKSTEEQLARMGVPYDQLVMGCGNGERILINDSKDIHKVTTCRAIQVERNTGIPHL